MRNLHPRAASFHSTDELNPQTHGARENDAVVESHPASHKITTTQPAVRAKRPFEVLQVRSPVVNHAFSRALMIELQGYDPDVRALVLVLWETVRADVLTPLKRVQLTCTVGWPASIHRPCHHPHGR